MISFLSDALLRDIYALSRMGPTAFNAQPARCLFVRSAAAKARLEPTLMGANKEKTLKAPVTVIFAFDLGFPETLPEQYPIAPVVGLFANLGYADPDIPPHPRGPRLDFEAVARSL